jgi:hypothetical protein
VIIEMSGLASVYHLESMGLDILALDPGLFNPNPRHVPLIAGPKADGEAICKHGSGKSSREFARTPILDVREIEMLGRKTLLIYDAPIHECLYEQASFGVVLAELRKPAPDGVSSADLKLKEGRWRHQNLSSTDSSVDKNLCQSVKILLSSWPIRRYGGR